MNRKAKLEKALALPENLYNYPWQDAAEWESERLASLHEALVAAMENLEDIKAWCKDRNAKSEIVNMKCLSLSSEALSKIDNALKAVERSET